MHIHAYTDGCVIILNAMVIKGSLEPSAENRKLSCEDYFERNIWNGFDGGTKMFLMKTSVVNSFTLELCERLTENPNCADTLDMLIRGNINLSRLGNEYRYHNLFLDSRVKLAELPSFIDSPGLKREDKAPRQAALVTLQMQMPHRSIRDFTEFLNESARNAVHGFFSNLLPGDSECFYQGVTAGLLMEQNKLNEAFDMALGAYNSLTESTSKGVTFGVSVLLAETFLLKSDKEQGDSVINRLRQWIEKNNVQYLRKNLTAYEERPKLWNCDKEAAESWLDNYFVNDNSSVELYKIYQSFTTARAYIVLSMTDKAAAVLEHLNRLGLGMNRPLDIAEASVLLSITEWVSGYKKKSRDRLHSVLSDIHAYGYVRVVANEGKAILPILSAVIKKMDKQIDKDSSLYRYVKEIYVAAYERSKRYKGLTYNIMSAAVKLSRQQALILDLLSKDYKNAEIVESTGLSLNTIRTHTKLAYQKLDVTNALDAIIKAKQLGLLE